MIDLNKRVNYFLISAPPASGKSTLIKWLYLTYLKKKKYDHVLVVTNTDINGFYKEFVDSKYIYKPNIAENVINNLIKYSQDNPKETFLLILDDIAGNHSTFSKPIFQQLVAEFRHYRIELIIAVQYPKQVTPTMRELINFAFIHPNNLSSIESFKATYDIINCGKRCNGKLEPLTKDDYRKMLGDIAEKSQYTWLLVDKYNIKTPYSMIEPKLLSSK